MAVSGFATEAGTQRYRARQASCHPTHFRRLQDLWASSIGLGTYLGDPDDQTDALYAEALEAVLSLGDNLIDTAINYRCQRSERVIGAAFEQCIQRGVVARDEAIVCTKGGYIPFDGSVPADPGRYIIDTFLRPGLFQYDDLVDGCHCLRPSYLEHQLTTSLHNLRVETVDVYYVHNPEHQLDHVSRDAFLGRMDAAFQCLETQVQAGRIRWYGTATWNGYRTNPKDAGYLSLEELVQLARRVGGESHHFRVVQLPFNLAMPEAYAFENQTVAGESMSLLEAAARLGLSVVVSASLMQSQLTRLPNTIGKLIPGLRSDGQRAIQFVRSTPGVLTSLVGMKRRAHVEENLALTRLPTLSPDQVAQLFARTEHR